MCTTRTVINAHTNMGGMDLKLIPVAVRPLRPFRHVWAFWLMLLELIASPNSPNGEHNPLPAAHPPPPPILPPPALLPPYMCHSWYYSGCEKNYSNSSSVSYLAEIVIKLNDCSSYTVNLVWLQSSTRKPQWFQYLKFKIPNMTIWSVFQNQVASNATY